MKPNMGPTQKKIRFAAGCVFVVAALLSGKGILALIGFILLVSSFLGYCPLCNIGKGSCGTKTSDCQDKPKANEPKKEDPGGCCGGTH